jgi:hypothetical protein
MGIVMGADTATNAQTAVSPRMLYASLKDQNENKHTNIDYGDSRIIFLWTSQ